MLSFKKGKPFCKVIKKNGIEKIVHIHDGVEKNFYNFNYDKLNELDVYELEDLKNALKSNDTKLLNNNVKKIYDKIINNGDIGKEIYENDIKMKLIPTNDVDQRDSIYITGPSGSGKSVFCSFFIEEYIKKNNKNDIILFSQKNEDKALDKFNIIRIPLDNNLVIDPIELDELENSLVIFDDIDQITDKNIQNAVWNLRDRILELGRSKNISICTVAHQITNYKQSRICLNEADYVVFFPKSGAFKAIKYFLEHYAGMDKNNIKKVMDLSTRWCVLKKNYPMAVIHQKGVYIP